MQSKRPKITVTEANREFVIPTLEKFGGVNTFDFKIDFPSKNEVYFINNNGYLDFNSQYYFFKLEQEESNFYEVDPSDYVKPFDPTEIPLSDKEITSLLGDKTSLANVDVYAGLSQLKSENEKLRECLSKINDRFHECLKTDSDFDLHYKAKQLLRNNMQTIAQQLGIKDFPFEIKDKQGNRIYFEDSKGFWYKRQFDEKGKEIYFEDSDGYWEKSQFDEQGNEIYYENSNGKIIDNRPKQVELTLDQIAEKFGIKVEDLKIKK